MWVVRSGPDGYLSPVQFLDHLTVIKIEKKLNGTRETPPPSWQMPLKISIFLWEYFPNLVDVFHLIHVLPTYSMFPHPGWQDGTIFMCLHLLL